MNVVILQKLIMRGSWILVILFISLAYPILNQNNGHVYSLGTILDQVIPFNHFFIVPYMAWYFFILTMLACFMLKDYSVYIKTSVSITLGLLICFFIFSVFQTTVPRPIVAGQDIFSQLTRLLYRVDNPYNAFPSIHVMTSYIIYLGSERIRDYSLTKHLFVKVMVVMIILSTLFLKQHTLLDVAGGVILGGSLFKFCFAAENFLKLVQTKIPGKSGWGKNMPIDINVDMLLQNKQHTVPVSLALLKESIK